MSTAEVAAEDFVRKRWSEIQNELARLSVVFQPDEVFETPKAEGEQVQVRTRRESQVGIVVASDVPNLLYGQVSLEIDETYSFAGLKAAPRGAPRLLDYSYKFSYMPELLIESRNLLRTKAKSLFSASYEYNLWCLNSGAVATCCDSIVAEAP